MAGGTPPPPPLSPHEEGENTNTKLLITKHHRQPQEKYAKTQFQRPINCEAPTINHPQPHPHEEVPKIISNSPKLPSFNLNQSERISHIQPNQSYLQAVKGCCSKGEASSMEPRNHLAFDLESMAYKPISMYKGKPAVVFPFSEKQSLVDKLKFVLVGKFSHGMPPLVKTRMFFNALKLTGSCNVTRFDKKHIFIECSSKADYNYIWMHLTWSIDSFVMRIFKWTADFHPIKESAVVPVWIRLEGLPLYLFDEMSLLSIANTIGNPLKVDPRNVARTMVNSARICVEIDLSKPLVDCLRINFEDEVSKEVKEGFWARVSYDVVPQYCHFCSHIGHSLERCKRMMEQAVTRAAIWVDADVEKTLQESDLLLPKYTKVEGLMGSDLELASKTSCCRDGVAAGTRVDASSSSACAAGAGSSGGPVIVDSAVNTAPLEEEVTIEDLTLEEGELVSDVEYAAATGDMDAVGKAAEALTCCRLTRSCHSFEICKQGNDRKAEDCLKGEGRAAAGDAGYAGTGTASGAKEPAAGKQTPTISCTKPQLKMKQKIGTAVFMQFETQGNDHRQHKPTTMAGVSSIKGPQQVLGMLANNQIGVELNEQNPLLSGCAAAGEISAGGLAGKSVEGVADRPRTVSNAAAGAGVLATPRETAAGAASVHARSGQILQQVEDTQGKLRCSSEQSNAENTARYTNCSRGNAHQGHFGRTIDGQDEHVVHVEQVVIAARKDNTATFMQKLEGTQQKNVVVLDCTIPHQVEEITAKQGASELAAEQSPTPRDAEDQQITQEENKAFTLFKERMHRLRGKEPERSSTLKILAARSISPVGRSSEKMSKLRKRIENLKYEQGRAIVLEEETYKALEEYQQQLVSYHREKRQASSPKDSTPIADASHVIEQDRTTRKARNRKKEK